MEGNYSSAESDTSTFDNECFPEDILILETPKRNICKRKHTSDGYSSASDSTTADSLDDVTTQYSTPKRRSRSRVNKWLRPPTEFSDAAVQDEFYKIYTSDIEDDGNIGFLFRGATSKISTSTAGMYGEIRPSCLRNICAEFEKYGLDEKSVVLDLGSGRGVPNCVFASCVPVFASIGVELCPLAYTSAVHILLTLLAKDVSKIKKEAILERDATESEYNCVYETPVATKYAKASTSDSTSDTANTTRIDVGDVQTQIVDGADFDEYVATPNPLISPRLYRDGETCYGEFKNFGSTGNDDAFSRAYEKFQNTPSRMGLAFVNEDITAYENFNGVTHFYTFDTAMERALINNMVHQFQATKTAWTFASFQSNLIQKFGLKDCFIGAKVPCQMYGSGETHPCFIYVKNDWQRIKQRVDEAFCSSNITGNRIQTNKWCEPSDATEIIKLAKLPLRWQFEWYLQKLFKCNNSCVTRSKRDICGYSKDTRQELFKERDALIEQIALEEDAAVRKLRKQLIEHIKKHYSPNGRFP